MTLPPRKPGAAELEKVAEGLLRRGTNSSNWLLSLGGMVGLTAFPPNTGPYLYTQNKCINSLKPVGKGLLEDYSVASHV